MLDFYLYVWYTLCIYLQFREMSSNSLTLEDFAFFFPWQILLGN